MKRFWSILAVLALLAAPAGTKQAFAGCGRGGCGSSCGDCAPACAPAVTWVDQVVTVCKPTWKERPVTYTVNRMYTKEVIVPMTRTVMMPEYKDVVRTINVCRLVPKVIEREVVCCRMVPVCVTDPCSGCCYTVCKPETYTQKVSCTVLERVMEPRAITERVCSYKPVQETIQCKKLVCECKPEAVTVTERYCVMEQVQQTIKVPVCTPVCAPACSTCSH